MNEQVKRLADGIIHFAATNGSADDIKAALRQAIKQVNQAQHREEQKRAAAERAASEPAPDTLDEAQAMSLRQAREAAAVNGDC